MLTITHAEVADTCKSYWEVKIILGISLISDNGKEYKISGHSQCRVSRGAGTKQLLQFIVSVLALWASLD